MTTKYLWTIRACVATPILLLLVVFLAGGGHGTYFPVITFFPFEMLGILFDVQSEIVLAAIAIVQLPIYGIALDLSKTKGKFNLTCLILASVHIAAVVYSAILQTREF